jgi:hypothetical protein
MLARPANTARVAMIVTTALRSSMMIIGREYGMGMAARNEQPGIREGT